MDIHICMVINSSQHFLPLKAYFKTLQNAMSTCSAFALRLSQHHQVKNLSSIAAPVAKGNACTEGRRHNLSTSWMQKPKPPRRKQRAAWKSCCFIFKSITSDNNRLHWINRSHLSAAEVVTCMIYFYLKIWIKYFRRNPELPTEERKQQYFLLGFGCSSGNW